MASMDIGTSLSNIKTMLSNLTAWQTICGVATAAEAAQKIHFGAVEFDTENPGAELSPNIILDVTSLNTIWKANKLHGTAVFELRFYMQMEEDEKASYSTQYAWIWTQLSAMLAAIDGAVGDAGETMIQSLTVPLMPGRIDPDENMGLSEWNFIISIGVDFI